MQDIIKESVSLSKTDGEELSKIYSKVIFPLSTERYPVCEFIRKVEKPTNKKLEKGQDEEMARLETKYKKLEGLVGQTLKENQVDYI